MPRRAAPWQNLLCASVSLVVAACGSDGASPEPVLAALEEPSAISPSCEPPPDCMPIVSLLNFDVCCSETLRCGFDLSPFATLVPMYPEFSGLFDVDPERPCWPRHMLFVDLPSALATTERVEVDTGDDLLVTPSCSGRLFTSTPLPGCCLPDDTCGYATHLARHTFHALAGATEDPGFAAAECMTATTLNSQLAAHGLAAWAHVPPSTGSCDHRALDAMLP